MPVRCNMPSEQSCSHEQLGCCRPGHGPASADAGLQQPMPSDQEHPVTCVGAGPRPSSVRAGHISMQSAGLRVRRWGCSHELLPGATTEHQTGTWTSHLYDLAKGHIHKNIFIYLCIYLFIHTDKYTIMHVCPFYMHTCIHYMQTCTYLYTVMHIHIMLLIMFPGLDRRWS